jgi:hypothetical protein
MSAPVEGWLSYTYWRMHMANRYFDGVYVPMAMHPKIQHALSDDGGWPSGSLGHEGQVARVTTIITAAVLDFREAYGAAFEEAAKDDTTLVPVSCLTHIDATVWYNICAAYGLYTLKPDGVTRYQLTDYFEPAWKEASIYRRAIAITRRTYREEISEVVSASGTPVYIPRIERSERSL